LHVRCGTADQQDHNNNGNHQTNRESSILLVVGLAKIIAV
jgi:hypothetical protein